jgi:integrase
MKRQDKQTLLSRFLKLFESRAASMLAEKTMRSYLLSGRTFIGIVGDRSLAKYTLADVDRFKAEYSKKVKPTSVNVALRSLKAIFGRAVDWELVKATPFGRAKMLPNPETPPAFMTREEQQRFLEVADDPLYHRLFLFLFNTGLRAGEALSLRWEQVDLEKREVRILNFGGFQTKTRQNRVVPLNDHALRSLCRHNEGPFVFSNGPRPLRVDTVSKRFKRYVRKAGLPDGLHLHCTRHSFASNLVMKNVTLYKVGALLGHSNPAQTTRLYAHLAASEMHDVVGLL